MKDTEHNDENRDGATPLRLLHEEPDRTGDDTQKPHSGIVGTVGDSFSHKRNIMPHVAANRTTIQTLPDPPPEAGGRPQKQGANGDEIVRDDLGRFAPGTRGGPGASPLTMIRGKNMRALRRHAKSEHAVAAYNCLVSHIRQGSLKAAIEYLRAFSDVLDGQTGAGNVQQIAVKIVQGVAEDRL